MRRIAAALLSLAAFLVIWKLATIIGDYPVFILPAPEVAARVRDGSVSAREVVEASIRRIEALDPQLGAFIELDAERALAHLPDGPCQFPELVLRLLDAGERVAAYRSAAEWYDIGTVAEYERASQAVRAHPERFDLPHAE